MDHYKSWNALKKWLEGNLCDELQGRVAYFLTRYHRVHDSYGRASVLVDGREWVDFSWIERYRQESQRDSLWYSEGKKEYDLDRYEETLKPQWDENGTYCDMDFLAAILEFRNMPIRDALNSENYMIRSLAILDKRVGKRTLKRIADAKEYLLYPDWAKQFYELRLAQVTNI